MTRQEQAPEQTPAHAPEDAPEEGGTPSQEKGRWVTVREASEAAGVSRSALRKWYGKGQIESRMEEGPFGPQRLLRIEEVIARRDRTSGPQQAQAAPTAPASAEAPEGGVLVPQAAWEAVMAQLGNLHQAGQELAEARERAARAETEVQFLKERLFEIRKREAEEREAMEAAADDPGRSDVARLTRPEPTPPLRSRLRLPWRRTP